MKEIWKDCKGYEGKYQVSNLGRVWSIKRQHYLTPNKHTKGYLQVTMMAKNGKMKMEYIHRLVAIAFIPNPNRLPQVNHKDEDKTNNCVDNLEWCNSKYNNNYGTHTKRGPIARRIPIICVETGIIYSSQAEAKRQLGISDSALNSALNNPTRTAKGYHWEVA